MILLIEIKVSLLDEHLDLLSLGENHPVVLVTADNKLVRAQSADRIGTEFETRLSIEQRSSSVNVAVSERQQGQLIVHTGLSGTDWTLVAAAPIAELVQQTREISRFTWLMAFLSMFVAVAVGLWLARMIGVPLGTLRNLMQQGEQGDLNVRTAFNRPDEIGQLGVTFNQMMEQLGGLVSQLNMTANEVQHTSEVLLQSSLRTADSAKEVAIATQEIAKGANSLAIEAERGNTITLESCRCCQDSFAEQSYPGLCSFTGTSVISHRHPAVRVS